jgi:hypothetical protein
MHVGDKDNLITKQINIIRQLKTLFVIIFICGIIFIFYFGFN